MTDRTQVRRELAALRRAEVVLSLKVDDLAALESEIPGTLAMLDQANRMLAECRETIKQFKVIHRIDELST